jgi:hypothetical protein
MKRDKVLCKVFQGLAIIFLLSANSCEKEICMTCYMVGPTSNGTNGIILSTAQKMCGETGINHLRDRGYLCQ